MFPVDVVSVRHVTAAVRSVGGALRLNRQEVTQTLNRMFKGVSQEVPGHMTAEAPEETCDLMFRLYDRSESRSRFSVCLESVHSHSVWFYVCGSGLRPVQFLLLLFTRC